MADSSTPNRGLILQQTGNNVGSWGTLLNDDCISILDNNLGGNLSLSVAGGIDVDLTSPQAENYYYSFTGVLIGDINVVWPTGAGFYVIDNATTGAFTITVKPTGGTGVVIPQGQTLPVFISTNTGSATLSGLSANNTPLTGNTTAVNLAVSTTLTAPTVTTGDDSTNAATTAFVQTAISAAMQLIYPVGSTYISMTVATNPATLLGFGTWSALMGVCLVGAGTGTDSNGNTQTFTAGTQVGEYVHILIINEMPSHAHSNVPAVYNGIQASGGGGPNGGDTGTTTSTGGDVAHNNVQPVIGAYIWVRTA